MNERVEGTVILDGLVEGRIPGRGDAEDVLHDWVRHAASSNLWFSLQLEGGSFSILADNKPIQAEDLAPRPADRIADALRDLLEVLPAQERKGVLSTLRSVEYREGVEVQTLYAIDPDGGVAVRQRTLSARTAPAARPLTRKEKIRLAAVGVVVALLLLAVTSIFVDYRSLLGGVFERFAPFRPADLQVEVKGFQDYLTVEKKAASRDGKEVILTLKRGKNFPLTDADCERLLAESPKPLSARLAVHALAGGYVRCECFDAKGKFLGFTMQRISELREKETTELALPLPTGGRLARVVITY